MGVGVPWFITLHPVLRETNIAWRETNILLHGTNTMLRETNIPGIWGKERPARRQCRTFADSFLYYKNPKSMKHSTYLPVHFPRYNILFARFIYFPKKQISQDS